MIYIYFFNFAQGRASRFPLFSHVTVASTRDSIEEH